MACKPDDLRKAIVGTVEELATSERTLNLVRDQFETNYFGPVNIIRAALPHMRRQRSGHIVVLSGISMNQ
jgi:NAD(P)-dependent dehydrogenase (short-subunit alcohol dehydrogenase family)